MPTEDIPQEETKSYYCSIQPYQLNQVFHYTINSENRNVLFKKRSKPQNMAYNLRYIDWENKIKLVVL